MAQGARGVKADQVKRLKELEAENARLQKTASDLTLDKMILAEGCSGTVLSPPRRAAPASFTFDAG
jgi:hypothetical protein